MANAVIAKEQKVSAVSLREAKEIMGMNFFGTEIAKKYFCYDKKNEAPFSFSKDTLIQYKDSGILLFVSELSVSNIVKKHKNHFINRESFEKEDFAKLSAKPHWVLFRRKTFDESCGKRYPEQINLLNGKEEVSSVQELITLLITSKITRNEILYEYNNTRCSNCYFSKDNMKDIKVGVLSTCSGIKVVNIYDRDFAKSQLSNCPIAPVLRS